MIKDFGFDHIRLPVDEEILWDENGVLISSSMADLLNAINWCLKHKLRIIIDLHILRSHHFNARNNEGTMTLWTDLEAQDNLIELWDTLSANF